MATIPNGAPEAFSVPLPIPMPDTQGSAGEKPEIATAPGSQSTPAVQNETVQPGWWWEHSARGGFQPARAIADLAFALASTFVTFHFTFGTRPANALPLATQGSALLMLYATLTILCCQSFGLYRMRGHSSAEGTAIAQGVGLAGLVFGAFIAWSGLPLSLTAIAGTAAMNAGAFAGWRAWDRSAAARRVQSGKVRNVLIVGANSCGREVARSIAANPHWGFVVRGFVDDGQPAAGISVAGKVGQLAEIALEEYVDEIFIAPPYERSLVWKLTDEARRKHWNVKVLPEFWEPVIVRPQVELVGALPVFSLHTEPIPAVALCFKRALDVLLVLCCAPLVLAVLALLGVLIKLDSPGPVFYRAERVGRKGRKFCCWKLRTMVANADALKQELRARNQRAGPFFKLSCDPRITRLGKFLRKSSLDELPQLWNVLRGEMSLIGPRPHPVDDYQLYDLEHRRRLEVRPGITGLWQVKARRDRSFEVNMALDLAYIENWSLWLDLKILFRTIPVVLTGTGE